MTSLMSNGNGGGHSPSKSPLPSGSGRLLAPGTEVIATASFGGNGGARDLAFRKDEPLRIVGATQDPNWYMARSTNGEGLIPANCIRPTSPYTGHSSGSRRNGITPMPWLHGLISREEAEKMLDNKPDGTFLVRESTNYPGDYTLCMAYKGKTEHYRIQQAKPGKFTCDEEEYFDNLTQLVSHYKRDADGLCHRLVAPIISDTFRMGRDEPDIAMRLKVFRDEGLVIRRHELKLGDIVGHGEFGDVRSGMYKGQKVAVKVLKRLGVVDSILEEAQFMASLRHKNLVLLIGVVLDDPLDLYMVTEFMANGNLVDFLRSRGRHQVERPQLLQFALDICEGMSHLESKQLVHRDLAARNVLLAEDMTAKISDFGLAKHANSPNHDTSSGKFPIKWTAPESLRTSKFSNKSDMWSFGVLLWEIYSFGRVPYPRIGRDGHSPIQDVVRHIEKGYRMEPPEGCPAEISKLMNEAWAFKPEDRPSFAQIPVIQVFVWQRLLGEPHMLQMSTILSSGKLPEKRDSFRSYVKFDPSDLQNFPDNDQNTNEFDSEGELRLLTDELVAAMCENIIYYPAFGSNRFGKIFCTNFRLCFIPLAEIVQDPCCSRSLILADKYEVPLCAIEEIQYCSVPLEPKRLDSKKLRPMTSPFSTLDIVSCVKIFAKDFRVFVIDFQNSQFAVSFCNQMFHFSRPSRLTTLFQLARFNPNGDQSKSETPLFNSKVDWEDEMRRCHVGERRWRLSFFNCDHGQSYSPVSSYPECVVVPANLFDHHLEAICANWINHRFPVWCWSSRQGCAILRSSDASSTSMSTEQMWNEITNNVGRAHPENQIPDVFDVTIVRQRVATAYSALRKLCCSDLLSTFLETDNQWYTNVGETGWYQLVFQCLANSLKVVESITVQHRSVILKELEGFDMTAVVSSLAQLCLDPFYRTQNGFARLVQKEWCALGHPFGLRLFGASSATSSSLTDERAPVFLLFLDCVSQLVHMYEAEFEFSQAMLVSIWDLAITGLTTSFSSNSLKEMAILGKRCDAFPLSRFYSAEHCRLFINSLHSARRLLDEVEPDHRSEQIVLWPPKTAAQLRLWSDCYLRWSTPTHTLNGGRLLVDLTLSDLCDEVAALFTEKNRLLSARDRLDLVGWRHERHPAAGVDNFTSGYPYSNGELHGVQTYAGDSLSSSRSGPTTPRPGAAGRGFGRSTETVQINSSPQLVEQVSESTTPRRQLSPSSIVEQPQTHRSPNKSSSTVRSTDLTSPPEERYEVLRARPLPPPPPPQPLPSQERRGKGSFSTLV